MNQSEDHPDFNRQAHWERVYSEKQSTEVSWFQQRPHQSLELIKATGVNTSARIIDIGGGASTLVDYLLDAGYKNLSVLDISQSAIEQAKSRIDNNVNMRSSMVNWIAQDVTKLDISLQASGIPFDVWHDRAVLHFLTDEADRAHYVQAMLRTLKPGGHAIIATFNLDGPDKCSGLEVVRYSPETMSAVLGENFELTETRIEEHKTPGGASQNFVYCRFKRV